jgi:predicted outer membrane repeat protein
MSFEMREGVDIYGGFDGTETRRSERNWKTNETILSGEIGDTSDSSDNSFHVITGSSDAIINGFIVRDGYGVLRNKDINDSYYYACDATDAMDVAEENEDDELLRVLEGYCYSAGAGMINIQVAPTVKDMIFEDNYASKGGAVYNMVLDSWPMTTTTSNDAAHFENVIFRRNFANGRGGAVNNDLMTSPSFVDVQFIANTTSDKGGAIYNDAGCSPDIYNGLFLYNESERGSALIGDGSSNPVTAYLTFYGNYAEDIGAAIYQGTYSAENGLYNELQLNYGLSLGNSSGASGSSIANWHDDTVLVDDNSVLEYIDGELADSDGSYDEYLTITALGDDEYNVVNSDAFDDIGWSEERDSSDWETVLDALRQSHSKLYNDLPYDQSCIANSSDSDGEAIYVYANATGNNDGSSWSNAYSELSDAMAAADCYDTLYVSGVSGTDTTYLPDTDAADDPTDSRTATFALKTGISLLGGYCDGSSNSTGCTVILSGDLNGDSDWNDGDPLGIDDDVYHVLIGADDAVVSGFTVQYGNADDLGYHSRGAGMINYATSPTVSDMVFQYHSATEGAAITNYNGANGTFTGLTITNNSATRGAAILFRNSSEATLSDSSFSSNITSDRGGAVYIDYGATMTFTNLSFEENSTAGSGGALYMDDNASQYGSGTNVYLYDSVFENNSADLKGGAIALYNSNTYMELYGGSFSGNTAAGESYSINVGYSSTLVLSNDDPADFDVEAVEDDGTILEN